MSNPITDDTTLNLNQIEKLKSIIPSINYIIDLYQNKIKENDQKINKKLIPLKEKLNIKFKKDCKDSYQYLIKRKLLLDNINDNHCEETENIEFSLFSFKFINLNKDDMIYAKLFTSCVEKIANDANKLIEDMNVKQDKISNYFAKCKNKCIYEKIKSQAHEENSIIMCLDKCLKQVGDHHTKYTSDYIENLDKNKLKSKSASSTNSQDQELMRFGHTVTLSIIEI